MTALIDYALFAAKTFTIIIGMGLLLLIIIRGRQGSIDSDDGQLDILDLSARYREMSLGLKQGTRAKKIFKQTLKQERKAEKLREKNATEPQKRLFVIDFHGDIMASEVNTLREIISALLLEATPDDEVVLRLENSGGAVHEHGLAAAQLLRLRNHNIPLTVTVDTVAASGGYLMAVVANRILAAPFAIVGSIGVVAQLPNFNRLLQRNGIDFELHTAGDHKRTLTLFGENTELGREKLREQLETIHSQFKEFLLTQRPHLDINQVATGEYWHGEHALKLGLIDDLMTSDDYLLTAYTQSHPIYKVRYHLKKKPLERLLAAVQSTVQRLSKRIMFVS
jgi:serine protease SohB